MDLKRAVKLASDQSEVWAEVAETQDKLEAQLGQDGIRAAASASSLELTLSGAAVRGNAEPYIEALEGIVAGKGDVVGFAFAINGTVNSAEVYRSHALFTRLWPKLLYASSVEALAEGLAEVEVDPLGVAAVGEFLTRSAGAVPTPREAGPDLKILQIENDRNHLFETRYRGTGDWLHRSYLRRE